MIPLLILAGGRATRLAAASGDRPKFLMPVDEGRLFADVQLEWVRAQGFTEVVLSVGYLAQQIRDYVGDGVRYGLCVRYAEDGPTPLGTGGAVKRAFQTVPEQCALLYGDTMLELNCAEVVAAAKAAFALMTLCLCPQGEKPNGTLLADGGARYDKLTPDPAWRHIDYGFSVLSGEFLRALPSSTPLDLAAPLAEASKQGRLRGFLATRPFSEINTPEALAAFRQRFGKGHA
jgi:NDP-sugar pyrophosphorylase family protein